MASKFFGGSHQARSQRTGEIATGSLVSRAIDVPDGNWLYFTANGFYGNGQDNFDLPFTLTMRNVINVRDSSATGPLVAQIVPDADPFTLYRVDPLGAASLFLEVIDAATSGGHGWIGIDAVQTAPAPIVGQRISNGVFESGLTGWTLVFGQLSDASRHTNNSARGLFGGGAYASSSINGESAVSVLRSPAISMTHESLTFAAVGCGLGDGANTSHYRLLDSAFTLIPNSVVAPPDSDDWSLVTLDLRSLGLAVGDTFYLEMLDQSSADGFALLGIDEVHLTGVVLVPEPSAVCLMVCGGGIAWILSARRRRRLAGE